MRRLLVVLALAGCDAPDVPVYLRGEVGWGDLAVVDEGFALWGLAWHEGASERGAVEIEFVRGYPLAGHSDTTGCDASILVSRELDEPELTLAHELGHALAGLRHRKDRGNVMHAVEGHGGDATEMQYDLVTQAARARRLCP